MKATLARKPYSPAAPLTVTHPHLAKQWHPRKNGPWKPDDFTYGSNEKVWWLCKRCNGFWRARIEDRTLLESGCPYCAGKRPTKTNSLQSLFPEIAAEWHSGKNGKLKPEHVLPKSSRTVWWQCPIVRQHQWQTRISNRTANRTGCPFCAGSKPSKTNSLAVLFPALAREWDPKKNGTLTPADVTYGSNKVVWWRCPNGPDHTFKSAVRNRTRTGQGCPMCHGLKPSVTNSLLRLFPNIAAEWHPSRNRGLNVSDVVARSPRKVWWKCRANPKHVWPARIQDRTQKMSGCPQCAGRRPVPMR